MSTTIQRARSRLRLWPRLSRWGATDEEVAGPYPGAELVPEAKRSGAMAVTIKATPEQVWPWLVQMGWGRGGWYSWDLLDNAGRPSATEVHPEWQHLAVGDQLQFWALGRVMDAYRVAVIEPNRFLGLYGYTDLRGRWLDATQPRPSSYMEALWGFLLNELPDRRTRLVISGYQTFRPRWVERFIAPWLLISLSWPMQARMLAVLKRNIERAAPTGATTVPRARRALVLQPSISLLHATLGPGPAAAALAARLQCLGLRARRSGSVGAGRWPVLMGQPAVYGPGDVVTVAADAGQERRNPQLDVLNPRRPADR